MSVSNKRLADIVAPLDVLSEVITNVDPRFHDLSTKICQIIPSDLQVYIGDNNGGISFTGSRNVVLDISSGAIVSLTDFSSSIQSTFPLLNSDSESLITNFVKTSLIPQLERENI